MWDPTGPIWSKIVFWLKMASKLTRCELYSLKISIPYTVIQVWNDLEVGQVVKLPSKDEKGETFNILHPTNHHRISLENLVNFA